MIVAPPLRRSTPQIKPLDCLSLMTILSSIDIPNSYSQVKHSHWPMTMNKESGALTKKSYLGNYSLSKLVLVNWGQVSLHN